MISRREFVLFALATAGSAYVAYPSIAFADTKVQEVKLTDSYGRPVDFRSPPAKVMPMGCYAQSILYSIDPGLLDPSTLRLTDEQRVSSVPADNAKVSPAPGGDAVGGSLEFSRSEELVTEAKKQMMPTVDIGSPQKGSAGSLDRIETETGQQSLFLSGGLKELSDTYRLLGSILGEDRCTEMAAFIDDVVAAVMDRQASLISQPPKRVFMASGEAGIAFETFHYLQENVFRYLNCECVNDQVERTPASEGAATFFELNGLMSQNIDAVVFKDVTPDEVTDASRPAGFLWKNTPWVRQGEAYCAPMTEFGWLGSPLVSQCLGILWLGASLYPEEFAEVDLLGYAERFYRLFVHCEGVSGTLASLIGGSRVRAA